MCEGYVPDRKDASSISESRVGGPLSPAMASARVDVVLSKSETTSSADVRRGGCAEGRRMI